MQQEPCDAAAMPELNLADYKVLAPSILGMAFSLAVANLSTQQAHRTTGVSTYDGASMLAACVIVGALFASTLVVERFSKRSVSLMVFLSIHLAGLSALASAFFAATMSIMT